VELVADGDPAEGPDGHVGVLEQRVLGEALGRAALPGVPRGVAHSAGEAMTMNDLFY